MKLPDCRGLIIKRLYIYSDFSEILLDRSIENGRAISILLNHALKRISILFL